MARLIPSAIDDSTPRSERDVLDVLKRELPPDWMILHGQRIAVQAVGAAASKKSLDIVAIGTLSARNGRIRLISAREATARERRNYESTIPKS